MVHIDSGSICNVVLSSLHDDCRLIVLRQLPDRDGSLLLRGRPRPLERTWNSPTFGVSKILFPWQTSGLKAMACSASASATMGRLEFCRIARRALWSAIVRTTPHP